MELFAFSEPSWVIVVLERANSSTYGWKIRRRVTTLRKIGPKPETTFAAADFSRKNKECSSFRRWRHLSTTYDVKQMTKRDLKLRRVTYYGSIFVLRIRSSKIDGNYLVR